MTDNISILDLANVHGGQQRQSTPPYPQCPRNPPEPTVVRALPPNYDGRSVSERVIENVDRATLPWRIFNGIFGGMAVGAPRPNMPPPQRPGYER